METFTLAQLKEELGNIEFWFSDFCSERTGIGAPFNAGTWSLIEAAHKYVYLRESVNVPVNQLCDVVEKLSEFGEVFDVKCLALYDLAEKCSVYAKYDMDGYLELDEIAILLNTTEECLEESLKPGDLFYVEEDIICGKSPLLMNDPRFASIALSMEMMPD